MTNDQIFNRAWILLSIGDAGGCQRRVSRDALRSTVDSNNRDIPSDSELEATLADLDAAGLAASGGEDVGLTPRGCTTYQAANERYGPMGHIARMFALAEEWGWRDSAR